MNGTRLHNVNLSVGRSRLARVIAWLLLAGTLGVYVICRDRGWRLETVVSRVPGDLVVNMIGIAIIAGAAGGVAATSVGERRPVLPRAYRLVWWPLVAVAAAELLVIPWWPSGPTLRLLGPIWSSVAGAALGYVAGGVIRNPSAPLLAAVVTAAGFTFAASDVLGVGDYGAGAVAYGLASGWILGAVTWIVRALWSRAFGASGPPRWGP